LRDCKEFVKRQKNSLFRDLDVPLEILSSDGLLLKFMFEEKYKVGHPVGHHIDEITQRLGRYTFFRQIFLPYLLLSELDRAQEYTMT
jgi:hypothetical protein